ncbi:DJ-1/PfpI family protein [Flavobacterium aquicola]|uniref:Cyclohexyl-isocyanide hydratase n=1 Tax=Flavobacterium aquicola TaxID=1682742 RepID=A0A3E0EUY7_9FLAO|nr:DJ-1/PfpI family protein [Flavobacterium aquicola]REH01634.1 cyclohexyl-isocyanide hydratase [Flavobacterium aquicola]
MKIAYILFDNITWLDFIGIYDPISRLKSMGYLPDMSWDICAYSDKKIADSFGLEIVPAKIKSSLANYDAIIIPGGFGTRELQFDTEFIEWIKTAGIDTTKISICTGSLILGAAGFLTDKKATTNFQEYEALKPYCKEVVNSRIVEDGNVITAGAVSASIDLGLYLCEKWAGQNAQEEIRKKMDYRG